MCVLCLPWWLTTVTMDTEVIRDSKATATHPWWSVYFLYKTPFKRTTNLMTYQEKVGRYGWDWPRNWYTTQSDRITESRFPQVDLIINSETSQDSAEPDITLFIIHPWTSFLLLSGNSTLPEQRDAARRGMEADQSTWAQCAASNYYVGYPIVVMTTCSYLSRQRDYTVNCLNSITSVYFSVSLNTFSLGYRSLNNRMFILNVRVWGLMI